MRRVVGSAVLLAVCAIGVRAATNVLGCGFGEREVFAQFPRYGGRMPEPRSDIEGAVCAVWFVTPNPRREVYAYYAGELRERGWEA